MMSAEARTFCSGPLTSPAMQSSAEIADDENQQHQHAGKVENRERTPARRIGSNRETIIGGKAAHDDAGDDSAAKGGGGDPEHGRHAEGWSRVLSSSGIAPARRSHAAAAATMGSCALSANWSASERSTAWRRWE